MTAPVIAPARFPADAEIVRALFQDYAAGLGVDLCFQGFAAELAGLPGAYAPPGGTVLLARGADGAALGCVALRPMSRPGGCEMKRLYLRPAARGTGLGRALVDAVMAAARQAGYRTMHLDTLATMGTAQALYRAAGFAEVPAYYDNPLPGVVYMAAPL